MIMSDARPQDDNEHVSLAQGPDTEKIVMMRQLFIPSLCVRRERLFKALALKW